MAHPTVASKNFLVTIGDRSVGGLCSRDQMVGPWQLPLADVAITLTDFNGVAGEAMAMGERTPLALIDAAASARMAVGEAITNLAAAPVAALEEVKLSANWMAAASFPGEDAALFDAVRAVGMELCPELDIAIPVGKDSLSMQAQWQAPEGPQKSVSPVSLVITAFARVADAGETLVPVLARGVDSELWLIGLGAGARRMGGSILAQVHSAFGGASPDLDEPDRLRDKAKTGIDDEVVFDPDDDGTVGFFDLNEIVQIEEAIDVDTRHAGVIIRSFNCELRSTFNISWRGLPVYPFGGVGMRAPPSFIQALRLGEID